MSDIAILHKHYPERGGAERVADELARAFDAPVHTAYDDGASAADVEVRELFDDAPASSLMQRQSWAGWLYRDLYYYLNYDHCPELRDYDVVIQSGAATSWYVPPDDQALVRYVHSPPRTPYDRFGESGRSAVARWYSRVVRALYPQTASYPDIVVANSDLVARRIRRYLGRDDVRVVYPPVGLPDTIPEQGASGDYYLALSRLAPNKGFDTIIDAFREMDRELRIAGDGSEREALERRAGGAENIQFVGYVSDDRKAELLAGANALVYGAENEDFGLVPMEAFACGTPVIGIDDGFTRAQVRDGYSGISFGGTAAGLQGAIQRFEREGVTATPDALRAAAECCSTAHFHDEIHKLVDEAQARASLDGAGLWGANAQLVDMNTERPPATATDGGGEE